MEKETFTKVLLTWENCSSEPVYKERVFTAASRRPGLAHCRVFTQWIISQGLFPWIFEILMYIARNWTPEQKILKILEDYYIKTSLWFALIFLVFLYFNDYRDLPPPPPPLRPKCFCFSLQTEVTSWKIISIYRGGKGGLLSLSIAGQGCMNNKALTSWVISQQPGIFVLQENYMWNCGTLQRPGSVLWKQ